MSDDKKSGEEQGGSGMSEDAGGMCAVHTLPYLFWCNANGSLMCKECISGKTVATPLTLIEEAVPLMREHQKKRIISNNHRIDGDMDGLDEAHTSFRAQLDVLKNFKGEIGKQIVQLETKLDKVEAERAKMKAAKELLATVTVDNVGSESEKDDRTILQQQETLNRVSSTTVEPAVKEPPTLLWNIANTYMEQASTSAPPSDGAFISKLLLCTGDYTRVLREAVLCADSFKEGSGWTVYQGNLLSAVCALAVRQPKILTLVADDASSNIIPAAAVAALAKSAKHCEVQMRCFDSFYQPHDTSKDSERLDYFLSNPSLRLTWFIGHLKAADIRRLPSTVGSLGLAISNAVDAAAVSSLAVWRGLNWLHVAVSSAVAPQDLRPLPAVQYKCLHFYGLTDARVDSVRPAIEALVPDKTFSELLLPKNQLTAAGLRQLVQQLRGLRMSYVAITCSGHWQPGPEERQRVAGEFRGALGCDFVGWSMSEYYGR